MRIQNSNLICCVYSMLPRNLGYNGRGGGSWCEDMFSNYLIHVIINGGRVLQICIGPILVSPWGEMLCPQLGIFCIIF